MRTFIVGNEFGELCRVSEDDAAVHCGQDALDWAVDEGYLNADIMSDEDIAEAVAEGRGDDFLYAGNAGEVIHSDYLWIREVSE
tara:strand:+ start:674 stop:925 length:252 start_codon:yes stop_codon:yes gene_type:complete